MTIADRCNRCDKKFIREERGFGVGNAVGLVNLVDAVGSFVWFVSFVWSIWLGSPRGSRT